jgi:hypothetical protein
MFGVGLVGRRVVLAAVPHSKFGTRSSQAPCRHSLASDTARNMVRAREARRAFRLFYAACFWSYRPDLSIGIADVPWVAEQLRKHGTREAWQVAARLDPDSTRCSDDLDFFHVQREAGCLRAVTAVSDLLEILDVVPLNASDCRGRTSGWVW